MKKTNFGQSLIEVLASISVILLVIVGIVLATVFAIKGSAFSKNQALATKYAQEGMEKVRSDRDQDPETFFAKSGEDPVEPIEIFSRKITYNQVEAGKKTEVTVTVSWQDRSGKHEAKQTSTFTRW